jgi:hypothetical protein
MKSYVIVYKIVKVRKKFFGGDVYEQNFLTEPIEEMFLDEKIKSIQDNNIVTQLYYYEVQQIIKKK